MHSLSSDMLYPSAHSLHWLASAPLHPFEQDLWHGLHSKEPKGDWYKMTDHLDLMDNCKTFTSRKKRANIYLDLFTIVGISQVSVKTWKKGKKQLNSYTLFWFSHSKIRKFQGQLIYFADHNFWRYYITFLSSQHNLLQSLKIIFLLKLTLVVFMHSLSYRIVRILSY